MSATWPLPPRPYPDHPGITRMPTERPPEPPPPPKQRRRSPGDPRCERCLWSRSHCCPDHHDYFAESDPFAGLPFATRPGHADATARVHDWRPVC